jgi:hypothetical protein
VEGFATPPLRATLPFRAGWRVFRPEGRGFKPGRNPDQLAEKLTFQQHWDSMLLYLH